MLAQKEDAEKRILAKTNATLAHPAGWTSLQTQIADKQLELSDSHRTFSQSPTTYELYLILNSAYSTIHLNILCVRAIFFSTVKLSRKVAKARFAEPL